VHACGLGGGLEGEHAGPDFLIKAVLPGACAGAKFGRIVNIHRQWTSPLFPGELSPGKQAQLYPHSRSLAQRDLGMDLGFFPSAASKL